MRTEKFSYLHQVIWVENGSHSFIQKILSAYYLLPFAQFPPPPITVGPEGTPGCKTDRVLAFIDVRFWCGKQ